MPCSKLHLNTQVTAMNKLKRYTMGRVTLAKTENASLQGAGIIECENGEFYRCADIDPLLESIGAGGVSGRITSKTLEQHREEFEAFQEYDLERCNEGFYISISTLNNWYAWKAARGITE